MKVTAAVTNGSGQAFEVMDVDLEDPRADEVLVKIVATGLCHTDVFMQMAEVPIPMVLGHEGAGIVEKVGTDATDFAPGDHVLISFNSCGECGHCHDHAPYACDHFGPLNTGGSRLDGSMPISKDGGPCYSNFFGQSSFGTYALANIRNLLKVDPSDPLEIMGPLGCGLQTGAGTVANTLEAKPGEGIALFGVGAVGLAGVMAAKAIGCDPIIAVDVIDSRLEMAKELGATHVINGAEEDPVAKTMEITGEQGVPRSADCTGIPQVFKQAVGCLAHRGMCALVGIPIPGNDLIMDGGPVLGKGITIKGAIEGEAVPQTFIPQMIAWYKEGKFPFDKLVKFYELSEINQAIDDIHSGATVKAVLKMPH